MYERNVNPVVTPAPVRAPISKAAKFVKPKPKKGWSEQQRRKQQESDDEWTDYQRGRLELERD